MTADHPAVSRQDYDRYDHLIAMDQSNLRNLRPFVGPTRSTKLCLLDYTDHPGSVGTPGTSLAGCAGRLVLLDRLERGSSSLILPVQMDYAIGTTKSRLLRGRVRFPIGRCSNAQD